MVPQTGKLVRILLDPRVTVRPLIILRQLREKGVRRVPDELLQDLGHAVPTRRLLRFIRQWLDGELLSRHDGRWVVNSFMPPFPGPSYLRMFENMVSGRRLSPVSAFLSVTSRCPYDCAHCSARDREGGDLPGHVWGDAIRQLRGLGTSIIGFTGGEPLVRDDLPDLVAEAVAADCSTVLFTSGAAASPERIAALRAAGLWACCVSVDRREPGEHDAMRGHKGAFVQAREAVRLSREAGFYTMVSSVATRGFVESEEFRRVYDLTREWGCDEYRIVEPMPCGRLADSGEALLSPEHVSSLKTFHIETNRRGRLPKVCAFNRVEGPEVFGCGGGTQHLYLDAAGNVCPCDFTPLSFGNIASESLASVWARMTAAMGGRPRRDCFIQKYHDRVRAAAEGRYPLPPGLSCELCAEIPREPLPGYFAMVMGGAEDGSETGIAGRGQP